MAQIRIELSDAAAAEAEAHAKELGFDSAAEWCFEWLRNTCVARAEQKAHDEVVAAARGATAGKFDPRAPATPPST